MKNEIKTKQEKQTEGKGAIKNPPMTKGILNYHLRVISDAGCTINKTIEPGRRTVYGIMFGDRLIQRTSSLRDIRLFSVGIQLGRDAVNDAPKRT